MGDITSKSGLGGYVYINNKNKYKVDIMLIYTKRYFISSSSNQRKSCEARTPAGQILALYRNTVVAHV
jgi:hypothetical protein